MRDFDIESDLKQEKFQNIKLVQGDRGNKIKINVYEDGQPVKLTGCSITAKYKRADGEIINDGVIENIHDNSFDAVMDSSITKVAGTLKMLFTIEKDAVKVSAFLLLADVREGIGESSSSGGSAGGGEVTVDLSDYYKKIETYSRKEIDAQFKDIAKKTIVEGNKIYLGKADGTKLDEGTELPIQEVDLSSYVKKENGKSLITDAERNKLTNLENYDDSSIKNDIQIQKSRIDSFTSLKEGSTTGDAELADGRIGNNGVTYNNIGGAIRNQAKNVMCNNIASKTFTISSTTTSMMIELAFELYKGQQVEIYIQADDSVLSNSATIGVGIQETNDTYVDGVLNIPTNTWSTLTYNNDVKKIRAWIDASMILSTGNITLTIRHKDNIFNQIDKLNNKTDKMCYYLYGNNNDNDIETIFKIIDINLTSNNQTSDYNCRYHDVQLEKGEKLYVYVQDDNGILNASGIIYFGMYDADDNYNENILSTTPNTENMCVLDAKMTSLVVFIHARDILGIGNIAIKLSKTPFKKNLEERLSSLEAVINKVGKGTDLKGQTMSIIGDSYSTYTEWIPTGYASWYRTEGNEDVSNDVVSVKDTWWWQLSNETGLSILINNSYSGSTICTTGYNSVDSTNSSFVTRIKYHNGANRYLQPKPNIIFIFGGTNDNYANSPVGSIKYNNWTEDDLKSVLPAFCYMIDYLQTWNPQARIINIVNNGLKSDIINGMVTACNNYGIENIVLNNISKTGGHPNKSGMISIKEQVKAIL